VFSLVAGSSFAGPENPLTISSFFISSLSALALNIQLTQVAPQLGRAIRNFRRPPPEKHTKIQSSGECTWQIRKHLRCRPLSPYLPDHQRDGAHRPGAFLWLTFYIRPHRSTAPAMWLGIFAALLLCLANGGRLR